jgi:cell division protein FtsB
MIQLWSTYKDYAELNLKAEELEATREELKAYWSNLEGELEASSRLELLLSK